MRRFKLTVQDYWDPRTRVQLGIQAKCPAEALNWARSYWASSWGTGILIQIKDVTNAQNKGLTNGVTK